MELHQVNCKHFMAASSYFYGISECVKEWLFDSCSCSQNSFPSVGFISPSSIECFCTSSCNISFYHVWFLYLRRLLLFNERQKGNVSGGEGRWGRTQRVEGVIYIFTQLYTPDTVSNSWFIVSVILVIYILVHNIYLNKTSLIYILFLYTCLRG